MHTSLRTAAVALVLVVGSALTAGAAGATTAQVPTETTVAPFPTETTLAPGTTVPATGVPVPDTTPTTSATTADPATQTDETPTCRIGRPRGQSHGVGGHHRAGGGGAVDPGAHHHLRPPHVPDRWHGGQDEWDVPDSPDDVFAPTAARSVFEHQEDEQGFWWAED